MRFNSFGVIPQLAVFAALMTASAAQAQTVAYWRFEAGPADTDVPHSTPNGVFEANILDVSGNGNHLSVWMTGGFAGYRYRSVVDWPTIPQTGEANLLSVKNTGGAPGMFTNSMVSAPTGVDIETMTPSAFTIEASFKCENGGYRTIVGRDARGIVGDPSTGPLATVLNSFYVKEGADGGIDVSITGLNPGSTYKIDVLQSSINYGAREQAVLMNGALQALANLQDFDGTNFYAYDTSFSGVANKGGVISIGVRPSAAFGGTGVQNGCMINGLAVSLVPDGTPIPPSTVRVNDGRPGNGLTLDPALIIAAVDIGELANDTTVQDVLFTHTPNGFFSVTTFGVGFEADLYGESFGGPSFRFPDAGNPQLAALYFQVRPDNSFAFVFVDVAGYAHTASSEPGFIQGFDWPSDNDGLTAPWYSAAGVSDGKTMSLYVNNTLITTTDISWSPDTSLAVGTQNGGDWHAGGWSVGRGLFEGNHVDRGYGYIDEVRISNAALDPSQFLATKGSSCEADFNNDTIVNSQDFFDFLVAFFAASPDADFNHDTIVNSQDFFDFLTAFFTGC